MEKRQDTFYSGSRRRKILVAEDELVNRELLGMMLKDEYDIIYACDGQETLEKIRKHRGTLSLVLLDLVMPKLSGMEVLRAVRLDDSLSRIPIIVTTAERKTEIESLKEGAIDFIPKPYPDPGVIRARVRRTIELSEDRDTILSTEKDELTGLYNREFFYRYASQYDQFRKQAEMDAVIIDINHFHMINERYGKAYGDEVLKKIAARLQVMAEENDGLVCRREADTFMAYCRHREDYREVLEKLSAGLSEVEASGNLVRLRMGIYSNVDKSIDMERRFDRAKMAADTIKGSETRTIGLYDNSLHEKELYAEQLIVDFPKAIAENQFQVYYQPKFDVRPDTPVLASAEALVRWKHPELGMISPGIFIPLFEKNGLIQKLDLFVWKETARQIRDWRDRLCFSIPVSVNVSRIDVYDPQLPDTLQKLMREQGLDNSSMYLEVTESAYAEDSANIIEMVEKLRKLGFRIEMDDFGTGYSSLNMLASLPIDVLKIDMQFIREAFRKGGNTHILEAVIGIADYLSVPVIAEGVETEDQLRALKIMGCDLVQGYFFSQPVPPEEFEPFILQRKEADAAAGNRKERKKGTEGEEKAREAKLTLLREAMEGTAKRPEPEAGKPEEKNEEKEPVKSEQTRSAIQLRTVSIISVLLALAAAALLLFSDIAVTRGYQRMKEASDRYIAAQMAAMDLEAGSDYLTDRVRCFVVTGEKEYLRDFFEEIKTTRRRDKAVEDLEKLLEGKDSNALQSLNTALDLSNELVETENLAMRLMVEAGEYSEEDIPEEISSITLSPADASLTREDQRIKAQDLVFNNNYMHYKERIRENVNLCTQALIFSSSQELEEASVRLALLVRVQTGVSIVFLLIVLGIVVLITVMIRKPLSGMVHKMQAQEPLPVTGVEEMRFVAETYNKILQENIEARERLSHEASHDALTGLFNRGAYDLLMESADTEHMALILIDVDYFKDVNDNYGHAMGDRVLKRVAEVLRKSFRSVDILCRIGGDEFAVVMTRVNSSMRQLVINKLDRANEILQNPKDDLPPVSLSIGVAFSDREDPRGDIFKDADTALYRVKSRGRKGVEIY